MPYKHTQVGYVMIIAFGLACLVCLVRKETVTLSLLMGVAGLLFSTLTVSVEGDCVRLWFGPGFLPRRFDLDDIESCQVAKGRCWSWGIHGWPGKCWLYNVSGFHSVELKMRNGMKYYIGTDRPEDLEKAIHKAMHESFHQMTKID